MKLLLLLVVCFCTPRSLIAEDQSTSGKGAAARSTEVSVGCFSSDSKVQLVDGRTILIDQLQSGDRLRTVHQENLTDTEMIFMFDKNRFERIEFYTLTTLSGHQISLTGEHLISRFDSKSKQRKFVFASNIGLEDMIYVWTNGQLQPSLVISIVKEDKVGFYAPLTTSGTLLVNDILVSSFSSVKDHHLTQLLLFPIRLYFWTTYHLLDIESFDDQRPDGIHWFVEILRNILLFSRRYSIVSSI